MFREDGMMQEQHTADDQSHYEISLTAGQAFVAFVLLLLSLAASFAFGLMLGKGQADERLVVRKETPVVTEASVAPKKNAGEIVELGVKDDDFQEPAAAPAESTAIIEEQAAAERHAPAAEVERSPVITPAAEPAAAPPRPAAAAPAQNDVPHFAQLLSTGDQKTAEALAVKLIDRGFNTAYVEKGASDKGVVFRVRVRFDSESDARAAERKLHEFSKEVWITSR
jgi:hypothetical protein